MTTQQKCFVSEWVWLIGTVIPIQLTDADIYKQLKQHKLVMTHDNGVLLIDLSHLLLDAFDVPLNKFSFASLPQKHFRSCCEKFWKGNRGWKSEFSPYLLKESPPTVKSFSCKGTLPLFVNRQSHYSLQSNPQFPVPDIHQGFNHLWLEHLSNSWR